jgi:hypothetical protein
MAGEIDGLAMGQSEGWHGSLSGYNYRGCRCDRCRQAKNAYARERGENVRVGRRAEQKRLADERLRHPCATPGCEITVDREAMHCLACEHDRRQAQRRLTQEMWLRGASLREIALALGTTTNSVGVKIARMRNAGWDMPWRDTRRRIPEHIVNG